MCDLKAVLMHDCSFVCTLIYILLYIVVNKTVAYGQVSTYLTDYGIGMPGSTTCGIGMSVSASFICSPNMIDYVQPKGCTDV